MNRDRLGWVLASLPFVVLTVLGVLSYLGGRQGDFQHFYHASRALMSGADPYTSHLGGYIYPPFFAMLLAPIAMLSLAHAGAVWAVCNGAMLFASSAILARVSVRAFGLPAHVAPGASLIGSLVLIDKARAVIMMGQTDALVLLGIAFALMHLHERPWRAGFSLACSVVIKYQAVIFLPYLLIRRRWATLLASIGGIALLLFGPALVHGWPATIRMLGDAFGVFGTVLGESPSGVVHELTWDRSVSLTSAFARLQSALDLPRLATVGMVLGASGAILAGVVAIYRRLEVRLFGDGHLVEWAGLIVAALVFSPQSEARHMLLALALTIPTSAMILAAPRHRV
ncbi:MAG: DUF2029 domain-containing protein, partial [Phycisphaerales bacterium]|nr:DUF2029 domain-containing protein [Phycisphaerales bacterium]